MCYTQEEIKATKEIPKNMWSWLVPGSEDYGKQLNSQNLLMEFGTNWSKAGVEKSKRVGNNEGAKSGSRNWIR